MANFRAVFDVGNSIARFLTNAYPADLRASFPCTFQLVSSAQIATEGEVALDQTVSIFLHRITIDEFSRSVTRIQDQPGIQPSLFLNLHYLVTYWGASAEAEQTVLAWTMEQLQTTPILDSSVLSATAGWSVTEQIQLMPADLSLEDILRIWDALGPKYRLSISYLARVVRIDRTLDDEDLPIVATRFRFDTAIPVGGAS